MKDWDKEFEKEIEAYKSWKDKFGGFSRDMTLRDHFAGLAMQSLIADPDLSWELTLDATKTAYKIADAMLEARKT